MSDNHSLGYSMNGYKCAHARYYYPLEFTTAFFNWAKDRDDIVDGMELAERYGINVKMPTFGYSKGEYFMDRETSSVYKGIGSVKFFNVDRGDKLFELGQRKFRDFVEVLVTLVETGICNKRHISILIKLGYFNRFGGRKYLLNIQDYFNEQYKKTYVDRTKIKRLAIIREYVDTLHDEDMTMKEIAEAELEYLGYMAYIDRSFADNEVLVSGLNFNRWGTPFATLYQINSSKETTIKLYKNTFKRNKFEEGDVLELHHILKVPKKRKVDGKFINLDEKEQILDKYTVLDNVK